MKIGGKCFNKDLINYIKETIKQEPKISHSALFIPQGVCGWLNWRSPNGKLCDLSCRKALLKLDRRDIIELTKSKSFSKRRDNILANISNIAEIDGDITTLWEIEVMQIPHSSSNLFLIWNNLINKIPLLRKWSPVRCQIPDSLSNKE